MITLQEPIARILKDFCHVEWYEVDELAALVSGGTAKFDVNSLRQQFETLILQPNGIAVPINKLTANEFESDGEACVWLKDLYRNVFG